MNTAKLFMSDIFLTDSDTYGSCGFYLANQVHLTHIINTLPIKTQVHSMLL